MQVEKGRNGETVKEGKSKGNYEALDIEEDVSKYIVQCPKKIGYDLLMLFF